MSEKLIEKIDSYWTDRASGYSKVNQDELAGSQKSSWLREIEKQIARVYPESAREEIHILDIGTGPGFFAIILAEAGYQVTAVDYTAAMLEEAKTNAGELAEQITFKQMDGQNLTFDRETFDVVISRNLTWVLQNPQGAYASWMGVLKSGGLLLNYDANWYNYLYDDEKRQAYEKDRENVEKLQVEDHYTCTDIDAMEKIALQVPLSGTVRPQWDVEVLRKHASRIDIDRTIGERVWSEVEKVNYASTPMFMIAAVK